MQYRRLTPYFSPYTHDVIQSSLQNDEEGLRKIRGNECFLLAKQFLADIPLVPTGNLTYLLTEQIQFGLLDGVCDISDVKSHWKECLDVVERYLKDVGYWQTMK